MAARADRILVIKLRAIGDVLLSTAVLPGLRAAHPGATIDFLTEAYCAPVVEGHPSLSSVLTFDGARDSGPGLIRRVRERRYDLVIDLFGNPRSAIVTLLSGAPLRVGYRFNWRRWCYNLVVEPRGGSVHNTEFNLDALRRLDIDPAGGRPFFPVDDQAGEFAAAFFREKGLDGTRVVALNPGGGWIAKRWRPEQYAALGASIAREEGSRILVLWGPGEEADARMVADRIGPAAVPAPPSTLRQSGALLRLCAALVTNDSGPMHIAAALGVPVVAIFGPTVPSLQGPVHTESEIVVREGLDCLGCAHTVCPIGNPCMLELGTGVVHSAYRRLAGRTTKASATG